MKKLLLLVTLFTSFTLFAQRFYPSPVPIPETGLQQFQLNNPYILVLGHTNPNDLTQWLPTNRYILEDAPNIDYTGTRINSSWVNNSWEDGIEVRNSFILDSENRLHIVYDKSKYFSDPTKSKYVFEYNNANQLSLLKYYEESSEFPDSFLLSSSNYYTYDVSGKTILDSNIYHFSGNATYLSHYVYNGDKLALIARLYGTDSVGKTYYSFDGDLLVNLTQMSFDPDADEWGITYTDTFEYNVMDQVSRRSTAGFTIRDGVVSFEPFRNDSYTYTSDNQVQEIVERVWLNETWNDNMKTIFTYLPNHKAEVGYVYFADGNGGWNSDAHLKYQFQLMTGLKHIHNKGPGVAIYPNPVNDVIAIDMDKQQANVKLFDMAGKCVYEQTGVSGKHQIDLTAFDNGIYYVTIQSQSQQHTEKIIVRH